MSDPWQAFCNQWSINVIDWQSQRQLHKSYTFYRMMMQSPVDRFSKSAWCNCRMCRS